MEIKAVDGWEGYFVCDNGDVIGKFGRPMKGKIDRYGYRTYTLMKDGKKHSKTGHRLVALAFVDNPANLQTVNHKDGNKLNNAASNLEWMSSKDNIRHAVTYGLRTGYGERHYNTKLQDVDVFAILDMYFIQKHKQKYIRELFDISKNTISKIICGRKWKHISTPFFLWNNMEVPTVV